MEHAGLRTFTRFAGLISIFSLFFFSLHPVFSEEKKTAYGDEKSIGSDSELAPCCRKENEGVGEGKPGIEEHLGTGLPLELSFTNERGISRPLKEWLGKPTLLAFVYYRCPVMCNLIQGSVADAVKKVTLKPGVDYNVISISFDDTDTPAAALQKKGEFMNLLGPGFPETAWTFLTGSKENIAAVTKMAGFFYQKIDRDFVHPAVLFVLAADGKIVRYLHGTRFLPLSVSLALTEASEGRVGTAVKSVVSFCFTYDPVGRKYVLNIMRISGSIILVMGGIIMFFILRKPNETSGKIQDGTGSSKLS